MAWKSNWKPKAKAPIRWKHVRVTEALLDETLGELAACGHFINSVSIDPHREQDVTFVIVCGTNYKSKEKAKKAAKKAQPDGEQ